MIAHLEGDTRELRGRRTAAGPPQAVPERRALVGRRVQGEWACAAELERRGRRITRRDMERRAIRIEGAPRHIAKATVNEDRRGHDHRPWAVADNARREAQLTSKGLFGEPRVIRIVENRVYLNTELDGTLALDIERGSARGAGRRDAHGAGDEREVIPVVAVAEHDDAIARERRAIGGDHQRALRADRQARRLTRAALPELERDLGHAHHRTGRTRSHEVKVAGALEAGDQYVLEVERAGLGGRSPELGQVQRQRDAARRPRHDTAALREPAGADRGRIAGPPRVRAHGAGIRAGPRG